MTESQIDSTRVFVKGLPPSFTSDQLAAHFSKQYQTTDAHVLPDRRIGFVGFQDTDSAQNAVKFFNRSYIRMSKISVDLARPVEVKRDASGQAVPVSKRSALPNGVNGDRSRTRIESNGRREYLKRKRDGEDDGEEERTRPESQIAEAVPQADNTAAGSRDQSKDTEDSQGVAVVDAQEPRSDNDWLRGKTSRLLDLVDADEVAPSELPAGQRFSAETSDGQATDEDYQDENENSESKEAIKLEIPNGRLFVRNLAFDVTDSDLQDRFQTFGKIQEAHVVKDLRKSTSKGVAFVQFSNSDEAENALKALDGVHFHGRLLHILPASDKREQGLTEFEISKMPLKKQKAVRRKLDAHSATFSWNSLYMNPDAVVASIADRLGVSKSDILDPTSAGAAVKQAHAETQLIAETKDYLRSQGVTVDAFKNRARDDRVILLKNFPFGTSETELKELLEPFGTISKFILPPTGTIALVQYLESFSATQALKSLAYKNIKGSVLYIEKGPKSLLGDNDVSSVKPSETTKMTHVDESKDIDADSGNPATVFVRNLNFSTTTARLTEVFGTLVGFLSARVKTRVDPKRPGEVLSMGFGFVEFFSKADAENAISALNGYKLDGHELIVKLSIKNSDLAEERRKDDNLKKIEANRTKIIIKNLPFEATRKDVRSLFAQYGQLKTIRVPKKFDNSSRGFGFAEFVSAKEAQNAMNALSDTHLLGRRLVLQFTQEEEIDPEEQIQSMERKVEQQSNRLQVSKIMGPGRRRFVVGSGEDELT